MKRKLAIASLESRLYLAAHTAIPDTSSDIAEAQRGDQETLHIQGRHVELAEMTRAEVRHILDNHSSVQFSVHDHIFEAEGEVIGEGAEIEIFTRDGDISYVNEHALALPQHASTIEMKIIADHDEVFASEIDIAGDRSGTIVFDTEAEHEIREVVTEITEAAHGEHVRKEQEHEAHERMHDEHGHHEHHHEEHTPHKPHDHEHPRHEHKEIELPPRPEQEEEGEETHDEEQKEYTEETTDADEEHAEDDRLDLADDTNEEKQNDAEGNTEQTQPEDTSEHRDGDEQTGNDKESSDVSEEKDAQAEEAHNDAVPVTTEMHPAGHIDEAPVDTPVARVDKEEE